MASAYDMTMNVLGFREDDSWCALGLEVDIRGYGKTFGEACEDLKDLVLMQITFAIQKDQPDMIWRPSDPVYFERFSEQRRRQFRYFAKPIEDDQYHAGGVPLPSPQVISQIRKDFILENA